MIAYGPRLIIQPLIAAVMDLYIIKYYQTFMNTKSSHIWWIVIIINYSNLFSLNLMSRTLTNSIEPTLFIIAFYHYHSNDSLIHQIVSRLLVSVNFMMRPPSLVVWPMLYIIQLTRSNTKYKQISINVIHVVLTVLMTVLIDSVYFGTFTFTPYNFIDWNVI